MWKPAIHWGSVHTNPFSNENGAVLLRLQKDLRPHLSVSYRFRPSTLQRWSRDKPRGSVCPPFWMLTVVWRPVASIWWRHRFQIALENSVFKKHRFQIAALWGAFSNCPVFGDGFRRCSVDDSRIRSKTAPFTFGNGFVWTGPKLKAAKYETQKPSTCRATLFRWKFLLMFPVFHLAWSTCRATKAFVAGWRKLLRKVERGFTLSNKFWFCCSFFIKLTTCRATNLLVPYKSTNERALFLQPATNVFVAGQVDQARWKMRNIDQNLQRNSVTRQVVLCNKFFQK